MPKGDPNVVLIANPGADLYGSDRMVLETVRALVGAGRRVVVTVPTSGPLVPLLDDAGAGVVGCSPPIVRKGLLSPRGLISLFVTAVRSIGPGLSLIRRVDPGAVIVNTITPPLWIALARWSRRLTVCHVHEGEGSVSGILRRALYLPLVFTHRVIANGDFTRRVLAEAAPRVRARTVVVHNAVPGPLAVVPPRTELTAPTRLLYVGRLSHRKGVHVAVDALGILVDDHRDVRLDVVGAVFPGNEAYLEELHAQIERRGLGDRVSFLGFKSSVWDDLARADISVITSLVDETFGNTSVEAALAARPAVVSRVGGLPEAVSASQSATLVAPGDAAELAASIAAKIDDWPAQARLALSDSSAVAEAFSTARYSAGIQAALRG
ncbi:glycosyltransferase [Microbacterium sp. ISL-103]|uniref:glycosyltransferase n=1 Tax=Microbacterium sp. ISL-103 TaxID=2819156 RepID=UPI001BE8CADA|nr:glycosyltransferase [Microbacterium sp. ISL-103]MBT2476067.1 glycosyltransferase [Microbacterium sp. ISL-103]